MWWQYLHLFQTILLSLSRDVVLCNRFAEFGSIRYVLSDLWWWLHRWFSEFLFCIQVVVYPLYNNGDSTCRKHHARVHGEKPVCLSDYEYLGICFSDSFIILWLAFCNGYKTSFDGNTVMHKFSLILIELRVTPRNAVTNGQCGRMANKYHYPIPVRTNIVTHFQCGSMTL